MDLNKEIKKGNVIIELPEDEKDKSIVQYLFQRDNTYLKSILGYDYFKIVNNKYIPVNVNDLSRYETIITFDEFSRNSSFENDKINLLSNLSTTEKFLYGLLSTKLTHEQLVKLAKKYNLNTDSTSMIDEYFKDSLITININTHEIFVTEDLPAIDFSEVKAY